MQQLRPWIITSVAVALLFALLLSQLDSHKLYTSLQNQLAASGIQLKAKQLNLSLMYTGSIRLDHAHIKANTFEADIQQLYIDLDLPALLTGKAVVQALYLQTPAINILSEDSQTWLNITQADDVQLKRINISQGEIHFEQQHITLEKVDLDIRDIGKNQNPRMELRAHIGDGRIDAHGYLHMKRDVMTKGFGRVRLFDVPVSTWVKGTSLQTFSGSITSHIHQDKSWQSFGHISIQGEQKNAFELRGKLIGNAAQFLSIDEMVLNHKAVGSVQFSGGCEQAGECIFSVNSKKLLATPLLKIVNINDKTDLELQNLQSEVSLSAGQWFTSASMSWPAFDYTLNAKEPDTEQPAPKTIHMPEADVQLSNFIWKDAENWQINSLGFSAPQQSTPDIEMNAIKYEQGQLTLPITLQQSQFWLPISQWVFADETDVSGKGVIDGNIHLGLSGYDLTEMDIKLDMSQAEIKTKDMFKPLNTAFVFEGNVLWEEDKLPSYASLAIGLAKSTFKLNHKDNQWLFSDMEINFDQFKEVGITLPQQLLPWHGYIRGSTTLSVPDKAIIISQADVDLIQFGKDKHFVDGQIQTDGKQWQVQNLRWSQGKNLAEFFSQQGNQFDIVAESLDGSALLLLNALPFQAHGKLQSKALRLPFGTLSQVSSSYKTGEDALQLIDFSGKFYEGSLASKQVMVQNINDALNLRGTIQVGGIHLNNWLWLHKQFGTHLEASIYATLNLEGNFADKHTLLSWKGDGDVTVYNGKWLFHDKNIRADKVSLSLRRRKEFNTSFSIKDGKKFGKGMLRIDEQGQVSGTLQWLNKTYSFSKAWPNFKYEEIEETATQQP